jgi:hypothetical protein
MKFASKLTKDTLICSELQVKFYKDILKCSYGENPDPLIFVETICELLSSIANKPASFFKSLSVIDFFCLMLDLRINSQGAICSVVITNEDKKMTLELKLDYIRDELQKKAKALTSIVDHSNIEIIISHPSIEKLLEPTTVEYIRYITGVKLKYEEPSLLDGNSKQYISISTNKHAEIFFDKLPPRTSLKIIEEYNNLTKTTNEIDFLSRYNIKNQHLIFFPTLEFVIWFTKLMFNEPLDVFYNNIFYLAQMGNMNADYIENVIVGEYNFFVNCLKQKIAAENPPSENNDQDINFGENAGFPDDLL